MTMVVQFFVYLFVLHFIPLFITQGTPPSPSSCSWNDIELYGRVQVVDSFPDLNVQVVSSFPDLKVQRVDAFPDDCGEWQFVDAFPDFKIRYVDAFPDLKIQFVEAFPGVMK